MIVWKICRRLAYKAIAALGKYKLKSAGVRFGRGLVLAGIPIVSVAPGSCIEIGERAVLCSNSYHTALGVGHPVILRTLAAGAVLVIGDEVGISGGAICAATKVVIGSRTMLGANVTIVDTDFHSLSVDNRRYMQDSSQIKVAEVVIGENVFVGANSIILKGVSIGKNAVIGAGSVVSKDIPENAVAVGNPCRIVRTLDLQ